MLPEVTAKVRPPRALSVPFPLGYPLGAPNDVVLQRRVIEQALALCARTDVPVAQGFSPASGGGAGRAGGAGL